MALSLAIHQPEFDMPKLTIVAHIHAHPDHIERVEDALTALIAPTLAEDGCLQYDLHKDRSDPTHFVFYENWASRDLWQAHMGAPHIAEYSEAVEGAIEKFYYFEMKHLE